MGKELWFGLEEYRQRVGAVQAGCRERGLDMVLAFHPESLTYLTGHFTPGYTMFQFAIIPREGEPIVVLRDVEQLHFDRRAAFPDKITYTDGDDPSDITVDAIKEVGGSGSRIGIELTYPMTVRLHSALKERLERAEFVDIGTTLAEMREIKSGAEIAYMRRAGEIASTGMTAAVAAVRVGASERDIAIAASAAMIRAGSEIADPGSIASGARAHHIHGTFEDPILQLGDDVNFEVSPCVRYYYARFFRPIKVGKASADDYDHARKLLSIQDRALAAVGPGVAASVPDRIYRESFVSEGLRLSPPLDGMKRYPNHTFYSVGFILPPTVTVHSANPQREWHFQPGMTFHTYYMVKFPFSETILITESGYERLTNYPRELIIAP